MSLKFFKVYSTKIHKFKGGCWRYKLAVSVKFAIIAMSTPHKDTEIHGWTLALQTYSVLETCKVYSTKIHKFKGGYGCYKLTVSVKSAESKPYKETQIQGWTLALRTYSVREICKVCTIQRYEIDGWTLALQCP